MGVLFTNRTPILRTTLNKAHVYSIPINAIQNCIICCKSYDGWPINSKIYQLPAFNFLDYRISVMTTVKENMPATNRTPILRTTLNEAPVYSTPIKTMRNCIIWRKSYDGSPINTY